MARYKIVAHLIDPSLQDRATLTKEYLRDFKFIEKGGEEAMRLLYSKYPIDSNAYENLNSTNEFELEQDADGVYLFKRCDDMAESKTNKKMKKNTIKLTESQLKKVIAESVKRIIKEEYEFTLLDSNRPYDELIKDEIHRLAELSRLVPHSLQSEIYKMSNDMATIYDGIQNDRRF